MQFVFDGNHVVSRNRDVDVSRTTPRDTDFYDGTKLDKKVDVNLVSYMDGASLTFATALEVRDHCLCLAAQRAARALARRFDEALRPIGLTSGQFSLLMSLNRPAAPTLGSVAALLAMDRTTLTANLKPLERRGLLTVSQDTGDRRSRLLHLTEAGRLLLEAALPVWIATHELIDQQLAAFDGTELRAALNALA